MGGRLVLEFRGEVQGRPQWIEVRPDMALWCRDFEIQFCRSLTLGPLAIRDGTVTLTPGGRTITAVGDVVRMQEGEETTEAKEVLLSLPDLTIIQPADGE